MGQHFLITDAELSLIANEARHCPFHLAENIMRVIQVVAQRPLADATEGPVEEAPPGDLEP